MRKFLLLLATAGVLLVAVVIIRTARFRSHQVDTEAAAPVAIRDGAARRLAESLRYRTISHADSASFDATAFLGFHRHLERSFPRVHAELRRETVGMYSLLYTWPGTDSSLKPIVLMGHMDVVPVERGTEKNWQEDPFGGRIANDFVWGRGAIDNKSAVVGLLEAVEMLLEQGVRPKRTVHLAFGHDEEVGGGRGARQIAELLRRRGVQLELVLDEGGVIGDGILPGVSTPTALVGIAEKGFATVELSARGQGGHSSLPPRQSPIGILSAAIARLEASQMPARLPAGSASRQLFERIGPTFPFAQRVAFANLWLTRPLVLRQLTSSPATDAMVRTTTAVTMFQAGTKDNVLASQARAVVNFRILQGDSIAGVLAHVRRVVGDPRIEVKLAGAFSAQPSAVSRTDSWAFRTLEHTIRRTAPGVTVAPYLVIVVSDSRYFADLTQNVLRFLPLRLAQADLVRMHGTDERIAIADYERAILVYHDLIVSATSSTKSASTAATLDPLQRRPRVGWPNGMRALELLIVDVEARLAQRPQ